MKIEMSATMPSALLRHKVDQILVGRGRSLPDRPGISVIVASLINAFPHFLYCLAYISSGTFAACGGSRVCVWVAGLPARGRQPRHPHTNACEAPLALMRQQIPTE